MKNISILVRIVDKTNI